MPIGELLRTNAIKSAYECAESEGEKMRRLDKNACTSGVREGEVGWGS